MSHLPLNAEGSGTWLAITLGGLLVWSLACGPLATDGDGAGAAPPPGAPATKAQRSGAAAPSTDASEPNLACDDSLAVPRASGCAIQSIACGETVEGSNEGQAGHFDDAFYRAKFCTPRSADYESSPEAVYALTVPAEMQADVYLDTPCEDLDLFSIRWPHADRCPTSSTSTGECEGSTKEGQDTVRIVAVGRDEKHLVWADGKQGNIGNFRMRVECRPAR